MSKKITVDLRSLHSAEFSGVESYTIHVLEQLLANDRENNYLLYYNGFSKKQFSHFHFVNAQYKQTRIPNRLLNIAIKVFGWPKIESLAGESNVVFMPNWNTLSSSSLTKIVLTVHDLSPQLVPEYYTLKARIWHWFINIPKLLKRADKLIAVSDFTKMSLVKNLQIPHDKIIVAPLGVDHENYRPNLNVDRLREVRNSYGLPGDYVLFIGTLEPRKNLYRILRAFEQIPGNVQLVIAGKLGWKYRELLKEIENSPKRSSIKMLGYVSEADKPYIIKLAKAFIWPSLYEGFGLPILEAMAVGTPVLTSNVSSLPELAGDAALLVNPYNIEDIATAMRVLVTDESVRNHFISKGLERSQNYTWEKTAEIVKKALS